MIAIKIPGFLEPKVPHFFKKNFDPKKSRPNALNV